MKTVDILIFGGQSNMQGQSERLSEREIVSRAWEYRYLTDALIPLQNPVGENIRADGTRGEDVTPTTDIAAWLAEHALGAACYGHTNLLPAFCRAYTQASGREVVAVHAAKGSTTVAQWLPGTDGYRLLKEKSAAAIACARRAGCAIGSVYLIWLQGESDAIFSTPCADYKARLGALADALRADVGLDAVGVIRVGRFTGDARDDVILWAQDEICAEREDFVLLTDIAAELCSRPQAMNPHVAGHYSAAGLEMLGAAAGTTLAKRAQMPHRM
ncbi:MAG: hypothetical protein IJY66_04500 [Clostridia bacterium]|nr:hypothetical protein [Clostridia bacterium]